MTKATRVRCNIPISETLRRNSISFHIGNTYESGSQNLELLTTDQEMIIRMLSSNKRDTRIMCKDILRKTKKTLKKQRFLYEDSCLQS